MSHHHHHREGDEPPVVVVPAAAPTKLTVMNWVVGILILLVIAAAGSIYVYFRYVRGGLLVENMSCTFNRECDSDNCYSHGKNWVCKPKGYGDHSFPAAAPCVLDKECQSGACRNNLCLGR